MHLCVSVELKTNSSQEDKFKKKWNNTGQSVVRLIIADEQQILLVIYPENEGKHCQLESLKAQQKSSHFKERGQSLNDESVASESDLTSFPTTGGRR